MAVTKTTHTIAPTWTASGLAQIVENGFIDAGYLPSGWYSRFLSGAVENRVLQVVNDPTKSKGTVYHWFQFTTTTAALRTALQWNQASNIPSGVLYQDFSTTTTNDITGTAIGVIPVLGSMSTAVSTTFTAYKSGINSDCSFFVLRNGTNYRTFTVPFGTYTCLPFVDQDKVAFAGVAQLSGFITGSHPSSTSMLVQSQNPNLRSTYLTATSLRAATTTSFFSQIYCLNRFEGPGNNSVPAFNLDAERSAAGVKLPYAFTNTASGFDENHTPVFTSPSITPYMTPCPDDIGVAAYYASNSITIQDTLVVSSGVQEWEMIHVANNGNADSAKFITLARVV
jgi:hypothetical protein